LWCSTPQWLKSKFRQSENLMPIHISASPMESTLSNLSYLPNVNYFLPFFTSLFCTCVSTIFFFEPWFVHLVLGVRDILVILGSNLCLWSLKSSTKVANQWVKALGVKIKGFADNFWWQISMPCVSMNYSFFLN
jgi:hypothetical protein